MNSKHTLRALALAALVCPALPAEVVTHLFTNWYGVDAGTAVFSVNRKQVDPDSLAVLEQVKDYYKIRIVDGEQPPERVDVPVGVRLRAEIAVKSEPWLKPEKPWESGGVGLEAVIQDGNLYRVWYGCGSAGRDKVVILPNGRKKLGSEEGSAGLCYAESKDGFQWKRPSLGIVEFQGSKENNIVTEDPLIRGGTIFLDPLAGPEERYKLVANTDLRQFDPAAKNVSPVLGGAVSPDGIHWRKLPEPLWSQSFNNDGSPIVYHDTQTGLYVLFTRANYPRRRSIARAQTDDFRRWPHPEIILTPGPDEDPSDDFYTNPYLQYPGAVNGHLMLVSTYHRDTSLVDLRLASSMDGAAWNWLSPRTVVKLGKPGAWDGGSLYAVPNMVRLPDGRVAVGFQAYNSAHEEYWRVKFERGRERTEYAGWAIWEDGRIAGIEAEKAGVFTTLPLRATGQPIEINAKTGFSGSVRVEVLVEGEQPAAISQEMNGNLLWHRIEWARGDLASLAGKTIRLRFLLYNAKVFGFRGESLEIVSSYKRK